MDCPVCHQVDLVEIDTHADGFATNLKECGHCGAMWTNTNDRVVMIHGATQNLPAGHVATECPICHSGNHVEVDIHADGFAQNLEECGVCGALWSMDNGLPHLVHGATWA